MSQGRSFLSRGQIVVLKSRCEGRRQNTVRLALISLLVLSAACATTNTAQLDAFNGLKTIRVSVVAAVGVFNAGYQAGQFNDTQRTQLGVLYNKYLAADTIAATTLQATTTADPTQIVSNVTLLAGDVLRFVQSLKAGP